MRGPAEHIIQNLPPVPAIRLGSRETTGQASWTALLMTLFMRALGLVWLAQGLMHWVDLLAAPDGTLSGQSPQWLSAAFFFCVMDFVAAIGLWLTAPWGGVVWLVTVGVQVLAFVLLTNFWSHGMLLMASDAVLVPAYLAVSWYVASKSEENG